MNREQILNIFYNKLIPEASNGRVDCYFLMNMIFDVVIDNESISKAESFPYDDVLIPILKITNKNLFDSLLVEYVEKALIFYNEKDFSFLDDISSTDESLIKLKGEFLIKYVICTLFANASYSDFDNPISFLKTRIAMFDNKILDSEEEVELGYIDSIGASIFVSEEKSPIKAETPYRIKSYLKFDDGYELVLPEIYAGNDEKKYMLYGIQKTTKNPSIDEREYLRQIRKGFIAKINGAKEHYFLASMLFLSLCSDKDVEIVPFLIERWNAKRIALYNKAKRDSNFSLEEKEEEQNNIQSNITDIFLRYFTKLEDVTEGLEFSLIPFELDSSLHIEISNDLNSRSKAFNELFKMSNDYKNKVENKR